MFLRQTVNQDFELNDLSVDMIRDSALWYCLIHEYNLYSYDSVPVMLYNLVLVLMKTEVKLKIKPNAYKFTQNKIQLVIDVESNK